MAVQKSVLYLDYNSTTPVDPRVLETMLPFFTEKFGNAYSNSHAYGWIAAEAVTIAREQVANLIGAIKEEIIFTSGATESINLAIKGVADAYSGKGNHIITCTTEHKAVLDTCASLEKKGFDITYLPVNHEGMIDLSLLKKTIKSDTILISLMYANNETGVVHPIADIGKIAKERKVLFFCDATQAAGKIPITVLTENIDLLAFSSHKLYGPKGAGALYVRRKNPRVAIKAQIDGGGHERNLRSGTLNVPGIVGFGKACSLANEEMEMRVAKMALLRNTLEKGLLQLRDVTINGCKKNRIPNTTNLNFKKIPGSLLLPRISKKIAVSAGSACTSASQHPSHVLQAMGLTPEECKSSLRFSIGLTTTNEEIEDVIKELTKIITALRTDAAE